MPSYPIPDGPHNDAWKALLPFCFRVVDEVIREHNVEFPIQIGGGSMLLRRYGHRKSRDIDLFVTDVKLVRWCSPTANEAALDLFADYSEEANAVKLITGMQEIDIIAAAPIVSQDTVDQAVIEGRNVLIERPREIVAKKIVYRGRTFLVRDMFDMACVATAEPEEIAAILPALTLTHLDDLDARLRELEPIWVKEMAAKVDPYPAFAPVIANCMDIVRGIIDDWRKKLLPKVTVPLHPDTYRAVFSRDGLTVVIKEWDDTKKRHDKIGNTLGPAKVGPNGVVYMIGGQELSEAEWKKHPDVIAALGQKRKSAMAKQIVATAAARGFEMPEDIEEKLVIYLDEPALRELAKSVKTAASFQDALDVCAVTIPKHDEV